MVTKIPLWTKIGLILGILGLLTRGVPASALAMPPSLGTAIFYVKEDAGGANNGSSWSDAFTDLQSALAAVSSGGQIWVAAGVYKPTHGTDRSVSFVLPSGVSLYGGFAGTETDLAQRDVETNITILSGDIGVASDNRDNSYHVVVTSQTDPSTVLDGFTIRDGNASESVSAHNIGGGILNEGGNLSLRNLIISFNTALYGGGGMANDSQAAPTLTDIVFHDNTTENYGGAIHNLGQSSPSLTGVSFDHNSAISGGGMFSQGNSTPVLTDVIFQENTANAGGGLATYYSTLTLTDVTFLKNAGLSGAGMHSAFSTLTLTDVTFDQNTASSGGGGMTNNDSTAILLNVTFSKNTAGKGGGLQNHNTTLTLTNSTFNQNTAANGGGIYNEDSSPQIKNTILWGDGSEMENSETSAPVIANSIVQNGCPSGASCTNIINSDPLLNALSDNGGFTQTMALRFGSPAIDAADEASCPATDQRGVTRPQGSQCDIGAYEFDHTFNDVPRSNALWIYIERLAAAGITGGCTTSPLNYCPTNTVTRAQMAIFLLRGIHGASYTPPAVNGDSGFADVPPDSPAAPWIKELATEGITGGCGNGNYCPNSPVSRAQMAIFLLRAEHGSAYIPPDVNGDSGFLDVPPEASIAPWIKQLVTENITAGCGDGNYCPNNSVTRDQMAVFLVRTFSLP